MYSLKTGQSESVNLDGNVTHFTVTNNLIHDNDNIGFDAIGGEGVGPTGHDQASYGEVSGNTIYNISSLHNGGYNSYGANGLYCDGCKYVVFERNLVNHCDINIEVAAENGAIPECIAAERLNCRCFNYRRISRKGLYHTVCGILSNILHFHQHLVF